ncbi:RHS repeat-associated core domain-containing protein [Nonomuraea sp. NPDC002799]
MGLAPAPSAEASAPPALDWQAALRQAEGDGRAPGSPPVTPVRPAELVRSTAGKPATRTALPAATSASVSLGERPVRVGPLEVSGTPGRTAQVEVLDAAAAERAGVSGFVFRASAESDVSVDYSAFAERFGAGYADRLRLVRLPDCAPTGTCTPAGTGRPSLRGASGRVAVPAKRTGTRLTARVPAGVFAVTAGPDGEEGTFKATPLSLAGDWQVSTGSGNFSYTYTVPLPEAPAGPTPQFGLSYSSAAIDGLVSGRNTQSGQIGLGWGGLADSFIERRYTSCRDDGQVSDDLCWKSDNATISLNGRSGELVPVPGTTPRQWRLKDDPRWRVELLTGADNGDNDGEHWRVTTPDGVQYFFGLGANPDVGVETRSAWTVPVFGDDAGEPCHDATPLPWCVQAWRWNLDIVVDPHGNVQQWEYEQEVGHYAALNGWPGFEHTEYVRSGVLKRVKYGKRKAPGDVTPAASVEFDHDYRCVTLDGCPAPTAATAADYPDTPVDLMCFTAVCSQHAPAFFTTLRYTEIRTEVNDGDFTPVDRITLSHAFPDPDAARPGDQKLYLTHIQRTGMSAQPKIPLPPVTFFPVLLNNRIDTAGGTLSAMPHFRIAAVTNEYGGQTIVTYGQPHPCPNPIPDPPHWDENSRDCFPHWHSPEGGTAGFAVFHKWLTTKVEERDTTGGGPPAVTTYLYGDQVAAGLPNGAWHHDRDEFAPNSVQSWSEWRGYADVVQAQGDSRTRHRLYRGMHGDRLAGDPFPGPGSRVVKVASLDGSVSNVNDENRLAGRTLETQSLRAGGTVEWGTVHGYHAQRTVDVTSTPDPLDDAWFVVPSDTVDRRRNPADGSYAKRRTETVYNALLGTPDRTVEHGWTAVSGDERCTVTAPAFNVDRWMLDFEASVTRYANASCSGAEVSRQEVAYDGQAFGAGPLTGDKTTTRTKINTSPAWSTSTTTYDGLGRPLVVTDPGGHTLTTAYTPGERYPVTTTVTNHLGHTKTTAWHRPRQAPRVETDARGKKTSYVYDALGRLTSARKPTEQAQGSPASAEFTYQVDPDRAAPAIVRSRLLQDTTRYVDTWAVYDSFLRERQSQRLSPEPGKALTTDTTYDNRGLATAVARPEAVAGTAGQGLLPAPPAGWANDRLTHYDELSRPDWVIERAAGAYRSSTVTEYTHDTVKNTPHPAAGGVIRSTADAYGRTVRVEEFDGSAWRPTRYGYDAADRLVSATDPAGNTTTYTFDMAGRRTAMSDPDLGAWTYGYDPAGNQIRSTSATGVQLHTAFDAIGRQTERRKDSPSGPLLATWSYDATGEKGLLNKSTRFDATGTWVVDVTGYDDRERVTGRTWTVPSGVAGLAGDHTVGYGYDAADHQTSVTYPAVGGLPAETVTTAYNAVGLAETLTGAAEYVWNTIYDNRGRAAWVLSGSRTVPFSRTFAYDADQRLSRIQAGGGSTLMQDMRFGYDLTLGKVIERDTLLNGQSWRECFAHDDRQRLTGAFTTTGTCAAGPPGTGPNPYNHTYEYSVDGNLTKRVESGTPVPYTYPPAGGPRPHTPTAVGGTAYTWNANGDMATRVTGAQSQTFTWNAERQLTALAGASFVYDPDGNRLLRTTATATTLYVEGQEITKPASGAVTAVRSYLFDGTATATRSATGVEYLATENQGSVTLTVPTGATSPSKVRTYQPYGKPRTTDATATDRGWIGQVEDKATGLDYLNARYYDPVIGRFISPDPVFRQEVPQSLNPYAYGLNNPAAFADPSGLDACDTPDCGDGVVAPSPSKDKKKEKKKKKKGTAIGKTPGSGPPGQGAGRVPTLPDAIVEALKDAADDLLNSEWSGRGGCRGYTLPFNIPVIGGGRDECILVTEENIGRVDSLAGIGTKKPGLSATISLMSTNAHNIDDIAGWGVCAGGGAYGLTTTVCVSLDSHLRPTGTFIVLPGISTSGGAWVSFGWTEVTEIMKTPGWAKSALEHNARGTSFVLKFWGCDNDISCRLGALDEFLNPGESIEMAPGPMPGDPGYDSGGALA